MKKEIIKKLAAKSFKTVFRITTEATGFVHLVFKKEDFTAYQFREMMLSLKEELSKLAIKEYQQKLESHWLVRFDQQENTPFHVDNAANHSILMLGYEPSEVKSELQLADYHAYAEKTLEEPKTYFHKFTPVFKDDEELLQPFTSTINISTKEHYAIVIMNNSSPTLDATTLGVFHKAILPNKNLNKSRIVNSLVFNIVAADTLIDNSVKDNQFLNHSKVHT